MDIYNNINKSPVTLDLDAAASFLNMSSEGLRKKAKAGLVPASKPSKQWVFLLEDLVAFIRQGYDAKRQVPNERDFLWQQQKESTSLRGKAVKFGGIALQTQKLESKFDEVLKQLKEKSRKSAMT